ncbi:MAG: hypothetical protein ACERKD_24980, partial [Prolixibacteraceae bacterium]
GLNDIVLEKLSSVSEFLFGERNKSRVPVSKNFRALTFFAYFLASRQESKIGGAKVRPSARHQVDGIIANSKLDPIYNRIILPSSIFSKIHPIYELILQFLDLGSKKKA